jgi:hypothetical protein
MPAIFRIMNSPSTIILAVASKVENVNRVNVQ